MRNHFTNRRTVAIALAAWLTSLSATTPLHAAPTLDARELGDRLTQAFYAKQFSVVWEKLNPTMKTAFKSVDSLAAFREQVDAQLGQEVAVVDTHVMPAGGVQEYRRRARFSQFDGMILVQWVFGGDGLVAGFRVAPDQPPNARAAANSPYLDYQTKTPLRLPFNEAFDVVWGGRSVEQNYHAAFASQRFAMDLLMGDGQKSHRGDGKRNEDYFCFGQPLLAPGAGTVAAAQDGVPDNTPGQMNRAQIIGNHVVIGHGNGEYSLLAHLKLGSVLVKVGDTVKPGDALAQCGNSGNSSEPHLHYQLQDGPEFGKAVGMPAQFVRYLAGGKLVERGEPVQGQSIRPAP